MRNANSPQLTTATADAELVKRAADRAKRREERLKARQEGREPEEEKED